jgi:hypothetical protein
LLSRPPIRQRGINHRCSTTDAEVLLQEIHRDPTKDRPLQFIQPVDLFTESSESFLEGDIVRLFGETA